MEDFKTDKYEYLNAPILLENFKQTYLTSLNVFLNDDKFQQKVSTLPILKSSAITKYEKIIAKEAAERDKKGIKPKKIPQPINKRKNKGLTIRYIVTDHELVEITLSAIEESNECNSKLTDPFNSYFHENNEKIRKKALEQIISNIIPKKNIEPFKSIDQDKKEEIDDNANAFLFKDLAILEERYKDYELNSRTKSEKFKNTYKNFKELCDNHNIISLDQKIDYFVYLKKNNPTNGTNDFSSNTKHKPFNSPPNIYNSTSKTNKRIYNQRSSDDCNPNSGSSPTNIGQLRQSDLKINKNISSVDLITKYVTELKNNYKIWDDMINPQTMEQFESDLNSKIKSFQFLKKNFEQSSKFIDKLRMYLRCQETSLDRITLRECDITSDKFYYLVTKKIFDFGNLRHLNLSHNNLGDIGGCYLLTLIESFGNKFSYLNISYNKLGKQSCDILVDILQNNNVKITSLSIGGNNFGDKLFSDLCIGISKNSYLTKLFTHDNDLGKISSVILGTILKYDKKLKVLDVSKNNIGDENIGYMLKGLICNTSLEILMLNDMGLTNKSLRVFETTLCINTSLKELFLERNKLSSKGWRVLSDILNKNKYVEFISLVGNKLESDNFDLIAEQQRQVKLRVISKTDYFMQVSSLNENMNFYEYFY